MALDPNEQESKIVARLHYPPEDAYPDAEFIGDTDGYGHTNIEEQLVNDEDDYGSHMASDGIIGTQSMLQQNDPQNLQKGSFSSFVEETQFAGIELECQAMHDQEKLAQNETQNSSFGSRSFVGETQYADIEMDTQATEGAPQLTNSKLLPQRQSDTLPGNFISKPVSPTPAPFVFAPAMHAKSNREPPSQSLLVAKVAVQPEGTISKIPLLDSTPIPKSHNEPTGGSMQLMGGASSEDDQNSVPFVSDTHTASSIKPSATEKEVISGHNNEVVERSSDKCKLHSMKPPIQAPRTPATARKASTHQPRPITCPSLLSLVDAPATEKAAQPIIGRTSMTEQVIDAHNSSPVKIPERVSRSECQQVSSAHVASPIKTSITEKKDPRMTQNNFAANPRPQEQNNNLASHTIQPARMHLTPNGIFSQIGSNMYQKDSMKVFEEASILSVSETSRNENLKSAKLPSHRSDTLTSTPTHGPQRTRLRQKSSNQLNNFSAKTKFNVQGKLFKRAPFPEAISNQAKLQTHQEISRKAQASSSNLEIEQHQSRFRLAGEDLPPQNHKTAESRESTSLPTACDPARGNKLQGHADCPVEDPTAISDSRHRDQNARTEDSIIPSVEYEKVPPENPRKSHEPLPASVPPKDYHITPPDQHPSAQQEQSRSVSQANVSRPQSRRTSSRPQPSARTQVETQSQRKTMNRPLSSHDLELQGVFEVVLGQSTNTKVAKSGVIHSRNDCSLINQIGDHVGSQQKRHPIDLEFVVNAITGFPRQKLIIKEQEKHITDLNESLKVAESELLDTRAINAELEAKKNELLKRVERLNDLSRKYKNHINEVVICQKSLNKDSKEMKSQIGELKVAPTPFSQEIADRQAQADRMRMLLEEIRRAQREQNLRDLRIEYVEDLEKQIEYLHKENDLLQNNVDSKLAELQQERHRIEQLQKQLSSGEIDRHKEVMEILQKPQTDTLGELTKEDGMLHKVLSSSERTQGKLDRISTAVTNATGQATAWPQILTKNLEEFYSRIQTKLDDNGDKDTTFQESTVKLFDDLKERLSQINGNLNEKTKLSEQLNLLRENNATLKANLESKEAESESNLARLNELNRELADIRSQLIDKTEQLAISNAQPKEDLEMKRKVDKLNIETSRLQNLLVTANNDKVQAENRVQTHQAIITNVQSRLRETEEKLQNAESAKEKLEENNRKFLIECRSATERVRQETTQLALSQRKHLVAQHEIIVKDLKQEQLEIGKRLVAAIEESERSKETSSVHAKTIGKLESEIATYKDQLLQQKLQLQTLEESAMSTPQLLKQIQEHKQEIQSIRQEQANQYALFRSSRDESTKITSELDDAQKRLRGMKEENEDLEKENDRLRLRLESINAMTESSQKIISSSSRLEASRPSTRRAADRRSSNVNTYRNDDLMAETQGKAPEPGNKVVFTASLPRSYGENNGQSQTPIKKTIIAPETSPLTDLDDIIPKLQPEYSREDIERIYNKSLQVSVDRISHVETVNQSKYYSEAKGHLGTPTVNRNAVILAVEGGFTNSPSQIPRSIPSIEQESIQRRRSKPLKSAMKKGDHQESPIHVLGSSQDQLHSQKDEDSTGGFKKPVQRNNRGLQAMSRTGASSYNRIAAGKPNIPSPRVTEQNSRAVEPLYEPTPEIKRNAMKRARSSSFYSAQELQPPKPAKAPKLNFRKSTSKTVIEDSQDRL